MKTPKNTEKMQSVVVNFSIVRIRRDVMTILTHHAASRQAEADNIAAELAAIARSGMVLPGSITQRRTRCGHRNCGCHADPPRLHGPYWQWTRKVAAKTICRWLSTDQHHDYQAWIDNDRRLHELLARLEALGAEALEADPRWER